MDCSPFTHATATTTTTTPLTSTSIPVTKYPPNSSKPTPADNSSCSTSKPASSVAPPLPVRIRPSHSLSAIPRFNFNSKSTESQFHNDSLAPTVSISPSPLSRHLVNPSNPYHSDKLNKSLREIFFHLKSSNESNTLSARLLSDFPRSIFLSKSLRFEINPVFNTRLFDPTQWGVYRLLADTPPKPKKMHQTSSRLLRMTTEDRPFTRDFKDLFATLVVSLPLASHRVRLTRIDHSFFSEEAINNLGSLKFSQSNRMPDPKDPSRIVTTTTTTTFSMAREMARSVCQRFLDARFIESADGKPTKDFPMKGALWQLTPKGIFVLERFCAKNGIQQRHITEIINSPRNTMQLVILERDSGSDKLSTDKSTIEVIFRRFVGQNGPNVKNCSSSTDSESVSEYKDSITGVRMTNERRIGSRIYTHTFTGKATIDWLMECCTTVDHLEAMEIAKLFLLQGLIGCVHVDRQYLSQVGISKLESLGAFQPTKNAIYQITPQGKAVVEMRQRDCLSPGEVLSISRPGASRDSNTQKLEKILNDPALRLLFRENLRDTHCEENLSFYLDVGDFIKACEFSIKNCPPTRNESTSLTLDSVKETMASAYGIYNAFLAPGSPCELNIDHTLRKQLATRMTKAVGQDEAMIESLEEVTKLFREAQTSVFKLMASDSVPKFIKRSKYEQTLKNYDFDPTSTKSTADSSVERIAR